MGMSHLDILGFILYVGLFFFLPCLIYSISILLKGTR